VATTEGGTDLPVAAVDLPKVTEQAPAPDSRVMDLVGTTVRSSDTVYLPSPPIIREIRLEADEVET
jgi:hypothetical protein